MKSVQMMVFSYFVFNKRTTYEVSMLNASNKMKVCKESIPEEISEKVVDLLRDSSKSRRFGEAGYQRLLNYFSLDDAIYNYIILYRQVLDKKL